MPAQFSEIGGHSKIIEITGPTIGVNLTYADGDLLGNLIELPVATFHKNGTVILQAVTLHDLAAQSISTDVFIFNREPTASTFTDNAAADIADADLPLVAGAVNIAATDYHALNDSSVATKTGIGIICQAGPKLDSLWAILVTRGAPTYGANDLSVIFQFLQD